MLLSASVNSISAMPSPIPVKERFSSEYGTEEICGTLELFLNGHGSNQEKKRPFSIPLAGHQRRMPWCCRESTPRSTVSSYSAHATSVCPLLWWTYGLGRAHLSWLHDGLNLLLNKHSLFFCCGMLILLVLRHKGGPCCSQPR